MCCFLLVGRHLVAAVAVVGTRRVAQNTAAALVVLAVLVVAAGEGPGEEAAPAGLVEAVELGVEWALMTLQQALGEADNQEALLLVLPIPELSLVHKLVDQGLGSNRRYPDKHMRTTC